MSYFLPSFFQKRILRYALSRLELLDTDALDLEKLDIAWGRKSTIELRDVGIHIEKFSALLKLPRTLVITKAKISTLRVTVPADLYQSGIVFEVDEIEVGVRVDAESGDVAREKEVKTQHCRQSGPSTTVQADSPRSLKPQVHDPGGQPEGEEESDDDLTRLPTTQDLAQSFLQAEPTEERSELQAAVAQSLYINQSQSPSEDGLDASEVGMGTDVSLPGFLAGFLKGVGDRVQVKIESVKVDLNLKLEGKDDVHWTENVKIRLVVGSITIDAVLQNPAKQHTRRISISNIQTMIISEPSLFSNLTRSPVPSSPETTHARAVLAARNKYNQSSPSMAEATLSSGNLEGSTADLRESHASVFSAQHTAPYEKNTNILSNVTYPAKFATAAESLHGGSTLSDSFYSSGRHSATNDNVAEQFQPLRDSSVFGTSFDTTASLRLPPEPTMEAEAPQEMYDVQDSPPETFNAFPIPVWKYLPSRNDKSTPSPMQNAGISQMSMEGSTESLTKSVSPESGPDISPADDLAESRLFSHEEAASMYMSALSSTPLGRSELPSRVPGEWESSYPGENDQDENDQSLGDLSLNASQPESVTESYEPIAASNTGRVDQDDLETNQELERSTTPTRPLSANQHGQRESQTNIDPALGANRSTENDNDASSQESESPASSVRDHSVLAKRILSIDSVILELPGGDHETQVKSIDTHNANISREDPGSGPVYDFETSSAAIPERDRGQGFASLAGDQPPKPATVITIGRVQIVGDMGLTKLTILMVEKISANFQPSSPRKKKATSSFQNRHYLLAVSTISWKFLDLVKGVFISDRAPLEAISSDIPLSDGSDVLLKSSVENLNLEYAATEYKSRMKISAGVFSIGYAEDDILSFDYGLKMRESTRDMPMDKDILLTVNETKGLLSVDLNTLPLHIILDLRRLDETFGWFGGFSSMLGLGSSMMSTVTLLDPKAKASSASKSPRGVHFESPDPRISSRQATAIPSQQRKITARMGGFVFDLQGTKSALRMESTALRLVSRTEGVGLQIDRLLLKGPVTDKIDAENAMVVTLSNVRIEYLTTPKENDLTRLLTLLSPSKDTYDRGDDILIDTLVRQRRKGGVVRITIENADADLLNMDALQCFPLLAEEAKKLSTVAKYLPEDDRPGLLTLILVKSLKAEIHVNDSFGIASLSSRDLEVAHVTFPALMALGITSLQISRNSTEQLIGKAVIAKDDATRNTLPPMIMARFIGNEMEPIVKVKIRNARFEYHVTTIMAIMGLSDEMTAGTMVSDMVSSVATLTTRRPPMNSPTRLSSQGSVSSDNSFGGSMGLGFDMAFRDSIFGLNPRHSKAKGLIVLTDTHFMGYLPKGEDANATLDIRKAELMVIDDVNNVLEQEVPNTQNPVKASGNQVQALSETGYVSVSQISAAKADLRVTKPKTGAGPAIDVKIKDDLFVLECCADSAQTLTSILNGLKPPMPKSTALRYQTEVVPIEQMLASFSGDALAMTKGSLANEEEDAVDLEDGDMMDDEVPQNLEFVSSFYNPDPEASFSQSTAESILDDNVDSIAAPSILREIGDKNLLESFQEQTQVASGNLPLDIQEDHFSSDSTTGSAAHRRTSNESTCGPAKENLHQSPLRVHVRDVHIIWNLFDGYDWQHTRDTISQAVAEVQNKAIERQAARKRKSLDPEEEEEDVIGDFLFNSIYIGIPAKSDPAELARQVNRNIDDLVSETGSYSTSTSVGGSPNRAAPSRPRGKRLRLQRSKHHKLTFELRGVSADIVVFPPESGETQCSIDLRVQDLEIFDHVPTSTWKKFATYMHDAGERESGKSMIHLEILIVKPVPNLAASEIVLKASVLPLRLHVDQDALDFMTRFFEFKDDSAPPSTTSKLEVPFIQRAEVKSVRIRLDFKPKRIDYAGIRSGRTTEFMNFFVLDSADMVLRHAIIYGVSGFDRLGKTLNDIWMPDIKRNQLPGVLAGLAPVRSLVNVGGGVRDLVMVPIREYKKDGRVVRSFQKGALAFAKTTTSELMRLGAKLAIGTQTVLQGTEDMLNKPNTPQQRLDIAAGWDESELDEEEKKQISLYADQPVGVVQGLRGAYASLERDLLTAKDAVVAMPGEIMESGTAGGAARAVLRGAPTVILRPAMGVSKAVGQTLMGATNSLDPGNRRRVEDKYKKH